MVDLHKLNHAVMVARKGGYGVAAEALNISQPALSRSIQALEAEYGIQLFDRGRNGTRLTLEGARFMTVAEELLRRTRVMDEKLRDRTLSEASTVSFGMGATSAATFLHGVTPELTRRGFRLHVRVDTCSALQLLLRQGDIDFFISGVTSESGYYAANHFNVEPLPALNVSLMVRAGHPLLDGDYSPGQLAAYPVASGSFFRDSLPPANLVKLGLQTPCVVIDDYSVLARVAQTSDFIVIGSDLLATERPELGLVSLSLYLDSAAQWALVSTSDEELPASVREAITILKQYIVRTAGKRSDKFSAQEPVGNIKVADYMVLSDN